MKTWTDKEKMLYDMKLLDEVNENYKLVNKLFILCMDRGLRLVMENPYSEEHFLRRYWCIPPAIIDRDRRANGDYMKKPTQYWFIGFKPKQNLVFEPIDYVEYRICSSMSAKDGKSITVRRSEIAPQYASRFIRQYII